MDAADLARWSRFAMKGGIGKCTALQDCVAKAPEDLMFVKGDGIVVLKQLSGNGWYLGYCAGIVGRFRAKAVQFHSKLKTSVSQEEAGAYFDHSGITPFASPASSRPRTPTVTGSNDSSPNLEGNDVPPWPLIFWTAFRITAGNKADLPSFFRLLDGPNKDLFAWDDRDTLEVDVDVLKIYPGQSWLYPRAWKQFMAEIDSLTWSKILNLTRTVSRPRHGSTNDLKIRLAALLIVYSSAAEDLHDVLAPFNINFNQPPFSSIMQVIDAGYRKHSTPIPPDSKDFWTSPKLKDWLFASNQDLCHTVWHASTPWSQPSVLQRVESMYLILTTTLMPQNLAIYIYSLIQHLGDNSLSSQFWKFAEDSGAFDSPASHIYSNMDQLFRILKQCVKHESRISHAISIDVYRRLNKDMAVIVARLVVILQAEGLYKKFLESRGIAAQRHLDFLQDLLDLDAFLVVKPLIFRSLLRLSRGSGLHPQCFPLLGLEKIGQQVAAGGSGDIWKGLVQGQIVSVKVMRIFQDKDIKAALKEFSREALIWRQLCHPNLLPFFGVYYLDGRLCLVSPWMDNGNIVDFLRNEPPNTNRLSLIVDVALGLQYLHEQNIVHGDLKAINVLVTPLRRACIADFGLSTIVNAMTLQFTHSTADMQGGTARYFAPELFRPKNKLSKSFESDVYAFAYVCYEILTGDVPFHDEKNDMAVMFQVLAGERPARPSACSGTKELDNLWELLSICWDGEAELRPKASYIIEQLIGPAIWATATTFAADWDDTFTSKFRRSLQAQSLLPSVSQIERMLFGDEIAQACVECFPESLSGETSDSDEASDDDIPLPASSRSERDSPTSFHSSFTPSFSSGVSTPSPPSPSSSLPFRPSVSPQSRALPTPSITQVDRETLQAIQTAIEVAPIVWDMMEQITEELDLEGKTSLETAKTVTKRLAEVSKKIQEEGVTSSNQRALREDSNLFLKMVVQLATVVRSHGNTRSTLRRNVSKLVNSAEEFAILLHVSSFSPSIGRPASSARKDSLVLSSVSNTASPWPSESRAASSSSPSQSAPPSPLSNVEIPLRRMDSPSRSVASDQGPRSFRDSTTDNHSMRGVSPSPGGHESLRQKLSLLSLRRNRSGQSLGSSTVSGVDFELVHPSPAQFQQASRRSSEGGGRDISVDGRPPSVANAFLRTDSPAMSMASNQGFSSSSETSMDARRQQELKWVSLMDAVPPAQARKSKKVKKLLMDGTVPSSVRFRVWAYLTDTKAMVTPGVYAKQLVKRPRAPAFVEVEREIQRIPSDYPRINQTPLLSVLHAYLSIVPDIQYSIGLTLISGHLVTLAPEEDAFWIFVSIMNSYLRPYFSSNTTQIDVDTALFRRALEANDAQVAKKVLRDMSVNLAELCHSWFSTLFVNTLPLDYLNRVWGLFLYDGIPFLFRVGLTLFHCCRRQVLGAINQESLFDVLNHPSPNWLPPLNTFVDFAYGVRLKDGDLRKQRENTKDVAKLLARPFSPPPPRFSDRFAGL